MKKNSSDKIPSFQFYPNDWMGDIELQTCSLEARGLWLEILCLMHRSEPYGYIVIAGQLLSKNHFTQEQLKSNSIVKQLSNIFRIHLKRFLKLFKELEDNGVIRLNGDGYYSKRLIKEQQLREKRRAAGSLGGNPNLLNQKDNQGDNHEVNGVVQTKTTPSSSASSSPSPSNKKEKKQVKKESIFSLPDWVDKIAWDGYIEMRKDKNYTLTDHALKLLVNKLAIFKKDGFDLESLLNEATVRGWKSIFLFDNQPKGNTQTLSKDQQRTANNIRATEEAIAEHEQG